MLGANPSLCHLFESLNMIEGPIGNIHEALKDYYIPFWQDPKVKEVIKKIFKKGNTMKTKNDNFAQVLEFNQWYCTKNRWVKKTWNEFEFVIDIISNEYFSFAEYGKNLDCISSIYTSNFDEFLSFIQKRIELKELPDFDFEKHLRQARFSYSENIYSRNTLKIIHNERKDMWWLGTRYESYKRINPTLETAQILINAANELDKLKLMDTLERA